MRRRELIVRIDRLVLDGVDPRDRERVAAALERALAGRLDLSAQPRMRLSRTIARVIDRRAR